MSAFDFVRFLVLHIGKKKKLVVAASIVNGLCMAMFMYSLHIGLIHLNRSGGPSIRGFLLFGCSFAVFYLSQLFAIKTSSFAAYAAIEGIELRIIDKLRRVDYAAFKAVSSADIYAALGGDKNSVINAARFGIMALSGAVSVGLAMIYMLTLSVTAVLLILVEFAMITYLNNLQQRAMGKRNEIDFAAVGAFTASLRDIIDGFAELKMNSRRSEDLYQKKVKAASENKTASFMESEGHWVKMIVLNQTGTYLPLALVVFITPVLSSVTAQSILEIVTLTLILIGPASGLVGFFGVADMANNTLARMANIEKQLDSAADREEQGDLSQPSSPPDFGVLRVDNLLYTYPESGGQRGFTLKVSGLSIKKGELVIIKGGNGSGKSTFMRLLAGLFRPGKGDVFVDDCPASSLKEIDYRALFSIVFSDFYLFDDFYGIPVDKKELDYWAGRLELRDILKDYEQTGKLPTVALSSGQRKRTALLAAILEKKPVLLLDEVAADFDPEFRTRYYREILPELKAAGRTLLVVSHDDRYFDTADRIVEFWEGANV
jgi:putative ATP-binding cassette transporter